MAAYYNEIDPYAAQWLRNLIDAGHIADGVVAALGACGYLAACAGAGRWLSWREWIGKDD